MIDLDELEKLLAEATPGPWEAKPNTLAGRVWVQAHGDYLVEPGFMVRPPSGDDMARAESNAAVIVGLRNAAPTLLALARAGRRLADVLEQREAMMHSDQTAAQDWMRFDAEALAALAAFREADSQ